MQQGFFSKLRQLTNQLFAYGYSIIFVLIGGRAVLLVQQTYGAFWPCSYVEAWWQVQGSTPTAIACSEGGRESTVVVGTAIAFGIVLTLVRKLEWRLHLVACVAGLYFLLRVGYLVNELGHGESLASLGQALYVTRLELAGLAFFALVVWLIFRTYRWERTLLFIAAALLTGTLAHELVSPSGGTLGNPWITAGSVLLVSLICTLLGYLPAQTARWLRVST